MKFGFFDDAKQRVRYYRAQDTVSVDKLPGYREFLLTHFEYRRRILLLQGCKA